MPKLTKPKKEDPVIERCSRKGGKRQIMIGTSVSCLTDRMRRERKTTIAVYTTDEDAVLEIMLKAERMGYELEFDRLGAGWIISATRPVFEGGGTCQN